MENIKVLVVGINPWIDNTGINTLINFFDGWGVDSVAHIYTREKLPNTSVCNTFFQISEIKVLKSLYQRNVKTGQIVANASADVAQTENTIYKKQAGTLKQLLREMVWKFLRR